MVESIGRAETSGGAGDGAPGARLPGRLLRLIDPAVLLQHQRAVEARLADPVRQRVYLRRCAEVIAEHLVQTLENVA
jgi:hypothetical protein